MTSPGAGDPSPDAGSPSQGAEGKRSGRPVLSAKTYRDLSAGREEQGKFVLLSKGRSLHLVLSPVSLTPYHADIVFQYLQVEGRCQVDAVSSGGCRILSKSWKVHGGGYYSVQDWLHHILLHGKSTAFGKYDHRLLGPFADEIPGKLGLAAFTLEFG